MKSLIIPLTVYLVTSAIVFAGIHFGGRLLKPNSHGAHVFDPEAGAFANWDGQWYSEIAARGYTYDTAEYSGVAFFPAYPLAGRLVTRATRLPIDWALLLVSNAFFLGALWLMAAYVRRRDAIPDLRLEGYTLLALAVVPSSFFFRVAYSESMFLFVTVLFLMTMQRRWPLAAVAALVGLATAIRPVGVGLIPALIWLDLSSRASDFLWSRHGRGRSKIAPARDGNRITMPSWGTAPIRSLVARPPGKSRGRRPRWASLRRLINLICVDWLPT